MIAAARAAGPPCAFTLAAVLALAFPTDAVSLQAHTQLGDADFVVVGGPMDGLASSLAVGAFNGDNNMDLVACSVENDSCWLYYGDRPVGGAAALGPPDIIFVGPNGRFGASVSFLGDINGDGFEDIGVGAPNATGVGGVLQGGSLWIFFGRGDGFTGQIGYFDANTTVFGLGAGDNLGVSSAPAGDVDGDGYGDFWVSAPNRSDGAGPVGAVLLFRGRAVWPTELNETSAALRITGSSPGGAFGSVLLGGVDLNNDSRPDLATSSTRYRDLSNTAVGAAFAFLGPFPTDGRTLNATRADLTFWGNRLVPTLGASLAFARDFTVEGGATLFVGAPVYANNTSTGGSVYLFNVGSAPCCRSLNTWDAAGLIYTREANDEAGFSIAAGPDINHDGHPDLLVGAPYADVGSKADAGRVFIVYGKDVSREPLLLDDRAEGLEGRTNHSLLGLSLRLGDFTGDGWADLLVSAPGDPGAFNQSGAVYGFVGRPRNRPPAATIKVSGNLTEGSKIQLNAVVSDVDRDRLTWTWSGLTDSGANTDGSLVVFVTYPNQGTYYVELMAFDGTLYNTTLVEITVANAPPRCNLTASSGFVEGQVGEVVLTVSDRGSLDRWTAQWQGPPGMSLTGDVATFRPEDGAPFTVAVTAADNDGGVGNCSYFSDTQNVPPAVSVLGPSMLYEGESALYTAKVDDPGRGDRFLYNWTGPSGTGSDPTFFFAPAHPGPASLQLVVTDLDLGQGVANFTVAVTDVPPDVSLLMPDSAVEGESVNLTIKQYSGFSFDPLTVSWLVCMPGYAQGNVYHVAHAPPGDYCVEVIVFDDDGNSVSFNATLPVTNRAPLAAVKLSPEPPYLEGEEITLSPVVGPWETTPSSAIAFTWYLDGVEQGNARTFALTAPVGSHMVGVRAVDQDGGESRLNFTISVDNVPPTVRIDGQTSLNPGAPGTWHAEASDTSGKPVRLTWDVDGVQVTTGPDLTWNTHQQGSHIIRVTADDGAGGVSVASVVVTVSPPPSVGAGIDLKWVGIALGAAAAFAAGLVMGAMVVARIRERRKGEWTREREP